MVAMTSSANTLKNLFIQFKCMYDGIWQYMEIKYNLLTKQNFIISEGH